MKASTSNPLFNQNFKVPAVIPTLTYTRGRVREEGRMGRKCLHPVVSKAFAIFQSPWPHGHIPEVHLTHWMEPMKGSGCEDQLQGETSFTQCHDCQRCISPEPNTRFEYFIEIDINACRFCHKMRLVFFSCPSLILYHLKSLILVSFSIYWSKNSHSKAVSKPKVGTMSSIESLG
jgi:hypothetical protein